MSAQHPTRGESISHKKSEAPLARRTGGGSQRIREKFTGSNRKENTSTLGFIFEFYFAAVKSAWHVLLTACDK